MTDIVIQGIYGRMGRALIEKIAARQDCRVVAGVDREAGKVGDMPGLRACPRSMPSSTFLPPPVRWRRYSMVPSMACPA